MGLDTTHNCFHAPYSYFNELREAWARAAGIPDLQKYWDERRAKYGNDSSEHLHGLYMHMPEGGPLAILFNHSDCEGYILAHHCEAIADALQVLLPKLEDLDARPGHWEGQPASMYRDDTERFIAGLRDAADNGQNVEFH